MKRLISTLTLILTTLAISAQWSNRQDLLLPPTNSFPVISIQAERPTVNISAALVPMGEMMIQTAASHAHGFGIRRDLSRTIYNQTIIRTGIAENVELRLTTDVRAHRTLGVLYPGIFETGLAGLAPIRVGAKIKVLTKRKFFKNASIIGDMAFRLASSKQFQTPYNAHQILFTSANALGKKWLLNYNLGLAWNGYNAETNAIGSMAINYMMTKRITMAFEVFGNTDYMASPEIGANLGASYAITPDLLAGAYVGYGYSLDSYDWFWFFNNSYHWLSGSVGVSWKFRTKKPTE